MTEQMLSAIEWTCAVNRALIALGHSGYHGPKVGMLNDEERDASYEAQAAGVDPLTFVERIVAARQVKDADGTGNCAAEGTAEFVEQMS